MNTINVNGLIIPDLSFCMVSHIIFRLKITRDIQITNSFDASLLSVNTTNARKLRLEICFNFFYESLELYIVRILNSKKKIEFFFILF